jgi:hypothetical protein
VAEGAAGVLRPAQAGARRRAVRDDRLRSALRLAKYRRRRLRCWSTPRSGPCRFAAGHPRASVDELRRTKARRHRRTCRARAAQWHSRAGRVRATRSSESVTILTTDNDFMKFGRVLLRASTRWAEAARVVRRGTIFSLDRSWKRTGPRSAMPREDRAGPSTLWQAMRSSRDPPPLASRAPIGPLASSSKGNFCDARIGACMPPLSSTAPPAFPRKR